MRHQRGEGLTGQVHLHPTFTLEIPKGCDEEDYASPELVADNQSLVGALSWLSSQTRPDLTCSVSLAQQLQRRPTIADLKFTNQVFKQGNGLQRRRTTVPTSSPGLRHHCLPRRRMGKCPRRRVRGRVLQAHRGGQGGRTYEGGPFHSKKERKAKRQNSKVASQVGALILFADFASVKGGVGNFSIGDWRSRAGQRSTQIHLWRRDPGGSGRAGRSTVHALLHRDVDRGRAGDCGKSQGPFAGLERLQVFVRPRP